MSKSNQFENDFLALVFNGTAIANLADNAATGPATNLHVSLHTGDPGEGGHQATSESAYTSYARQPVARNSAGWTVSANAVYNTANITFPECSGGSETLTHFGVGTNITGNGVLLYSGALTASLNVSSGITPLFAAGELDISEE